MYIVLKDKLKSEFQAAYDNAQSAEEHVAKAEAIDPANTYICRRVRPYTVTPPIERLHRITLGLFAATSSHEVVAQPWSAGDLVVTECTRVFVQSIGQSLYAVEREAWGCVPEDAHLRLQRVVRKRGFFNDVLYAKKMDAEDTTHDYHGYYPVVQGDYIIAMATADGRRLDGDLYDPADVVYDEILEGFVLPS